MLTKRAIIAGLAGINLLLFALLLASSIRSPAAYAQTGGGPGKYITVTAKAAGQSFDVLYMLNPASRKLHAFYPARGGKYVAVPERDLIHDFERDK